MCPYVEIWVDNDVATIRAILQIPNTVPDSDISFLKAFFVTVWADCIEEYHGTYEERPQAYMKAAPAYHADIQIPVISLVGEIDPLVLLSQHFEYEAAVAAAGRSSLYRLYVVPGGGHGVTPDDPLIPWIPVRFGELIDWSDSLD